MTQTEGVLSPDDLNDLELWLHNVRTSDTLEDAFIENASSLVGWFVMLIDENKRLNGLVEDINAVEPEQIHISPREDDRCEDLFCSHCWPSWRCQADCGDEGHTWMRMGDNGTGALFCERCGQRKPEQENDPDFCWMMAEVSDGEDENHDWVPLGEFRTDEGFLVDGNEYDRLMCRACLVVESHSAAAARADQFGQEYLDVFGTAVPLDSGPAPIDLLDPDNCPHTNWQDYPLSGMSRCLGCGKWNEPEDKCEKSKDGKHGVIPIGVMGMGVVWTCTSCHKDFDAKPSTPVRGSEDTMRHTPDEEDDGPELPEPVAFVSPDPETEGEPTLFPLEGSQDGGRLEDDAAGDEVDESTYCYKTCTDPDCPYLHFVDENTPEEGEPCGLCGWTDPHNHSDPGVAGAVPTKPSVASCPGCDKPMDANAVRCGSCQRIVDAHLSRMRTLADWEPPQTTTREAQRRQDEDMRATVMAALDRAQKRGALPAGPTPLALTTGSPIMRLESCFRCQRDLDLTRNELTICTGCAEDDEIAAEIRLSEAEELAVLDLFVRLRAETVYLDPDESILDPWAEAIDVESTEVDPEDSPFTSEVAWEQAQDQPERVIPPFTTHQSGGWAA